jgi:hypothetical protein
MNSFRIWRLGPALENATGVSRSAANEADPSQANSAELSQRIPPPQSREAREVAIRGMQNAAVFNREGSELGIRYEGPACLPLNYHLSQKGPVPITRRQEAHTWLLEPPINNTGDLIGSTPRAGKFWICCDAEESCHTLPRQSH